MGAVYRAYDTHREHDVALKLLPEALHSDANFERRFQQEIKTIIKLEHTAIVPVYDYGSVDGRPYLAMRLMAGGTLLDRLQDGAMSVEEARPIIQRICSALDKAHRSNVIHRDLKPANILFDEDGHAYLADFGIAQLTEGTQTVSLTGTPHYMAPEQATGQVLDGQTDVYQMGAVLFQMLTGRPPYDAPNSTAILYQHVHQPLPSILEIDPTLPPFVDPLLRRALAKQRTVRFKTAGALATALTTERVGTTYVPTLLPEGVESTQPSAVENRPNRPFPIWLIGVLALVGIGLALWFSGVFTESSNEPAAAVDASIIQIEPTVVAESAETSSATSAETSPPTRTPPTPTINAPIEAAGLIDAQNVELVGHMGGTIKAVVRRDNLLFVGEGPKVSILDISNARAPQLLGQSPLLPGVVQSLEVHGDLLYAAAALGGLFIADVSDPTRPMWIGQHDTQGATYNVRVVENIAYVAADSGTGDLDSFQIVDVSDPYLPRLIPYDNSLGLGAVSDIVINGAWVYVLHAQPQGAYVAKLYVDEVYSPTIRLDQPLGVPETFGMTYFDHRLHVAAGEDGMVILSADDLTESGRFEGDAFEILIENRVAYISAGWQGASVVEVGNPSFPELLGTIGSSRPIESLALAGSIVYVADQDTVRVIDITDIAVYDEVAAYDPLGSYVSFVTVDEDKLYVNESTYNLRIFDINQPDAPRLVTIMPENSLVEMQRAGDQLIATNTLRGVQFMSAANGALPSGRLAIPLDGGGRGIAIDGSVVAVADTVGGVTAFDITTPSNPLQTSNLRADDDRWVGGVNDVLFADGYLYAAWRRSGLRVLTVDEGELNSLTQLELAGELSHLTVWDNQLFVSASDGGWHLVDISDPVNPLLLNSYRTSDSILSSTVVDGVGVLAAREAGVRLVDVRARGSAVEFGRFATPNDLHANDFGGVISVAVRDDIIYAAHFESGLYILRYQVP